MKVVKIKMKIDMTMIACLKKVTCVVSTVDGLEFSHIFNPKAFFCESIVL